MSTTYKTPGVYLKDIAQLPLSVTQVATAVPVFVGLTERAVKDGKDATNIPVRIGSLADFEAVFGGAPDPVSSSNGPVEVEIDTTGTAVIGVDIQSPYYLYYSLQLYFAQGGSDGYIVSVGDYSNAPTATQLKAGFDAVEDLDDPTLLVCPDAITCGDSLQIGTVQQHMLKQCQKKQDRFAILDVPQVDTKLINNVNAFRNEIGNLYLNYGASYAPYLETTFGFDFAEEHLLLKQNGSTVTLTNLTTAAELDTTPVGNLIKAQTDRDYIKALLGDSHSVTGGTNFNSGLTLASTYTELFDGNSIAYNSVDKPRRWAVVIKGMAIDFLRMYNSGGFLLNTKALQESIGKKGKAGAELYDILRTLRSYDVGYDDIPGVSTKLNVLDMLDGEIDFNGSGNFDFAQGAPGAPSFDYLLEDSGLYDSSVYGSVSGNLALNIEFAEPAFRSLFNRTLKLLTDLQAEAEKVVVALEENLEKVNPIYAAIAGEVRKARLVVPPSGIMAGVYAATDRTRGVWKAPANVGLNKVLRPIQRINNIDNEYLNVDPVAGKSVNAIRTFPGRGIMVWGSRTMDGNNNEWRYVPVRRLYLTVEESLRKATGFVVFEPNDGNTWLRVSNLISNYLLRLWREGALAGASPDEAFFVKVGLNESMTEVDILEGRMIIEVGLAAVRPAEFIVIKFSQTLADG